MIRLERNYRSTSPILAAASGLIAHNEGRLGKTLFTDDVDPEAPKVRVTSAWDSEEEARAIGEEIESLHRKGDRLNEMAILVRASFQMRSFEDRFVATGLNYRVIGGPRFYERQEIRDALAYFRTVAQPADDLAFERIVNVPRRNIGDTTVRLLHEYARGKRIPLTQAAGELVDTEEINAPHAHRAPRVARRPSAAGGTSSTSCRTPSSPRSSSKSSATPRCGRTSAPPMRPAASKTSRSLSAPWRISTP